MTVFRIFTQNLIFEVAKKNKRIKKKQCQELKWPKSNFFKGFPGGAAAAAKSLKQCQKICLPVQWDARDAGNF